MRTRAILRQGTRKCESGRSHSGILNNTGM